MSLTGSLWGISPLSTGLSFISRQANSAQLTNIPRVPSLGQGCGGSDGSDPAPAIRESCGKNAKWDETIIIGLGFQPQFCHLPAMGLSLWFSFMPCGDIRPCHALSAPRSLKIHEVTVVNVPYAARLEGCPKGELK